MVSLFRIEALRISNAQTELDAEFSLEWMTFINQLDSLNNGVACLVAGFFTS